MRHHSPCLSVIEVWLSSMAAASLVDAPWSWHLQCPAVSITMSSPSSQLHALASWALLCRASELPHVTGPQRLVGIFTQASWTPFTTKGLLRPFLVQAVFKKLSGWVLLSQRLPCYPVRNRWLLTGSTLYTSLLLSLCCTCGSLSLQMQTGASALPQLCSQDTGNIQPGSSPSCHTGNL